MNGLNFCITSKVPVIEGQNPLNAMYPLRWPPALYTHRHGNYHL